MVRIAFIVTVLYSACAEDLASVGRRVGGFGPSGLWENFYIVAWLGAAYAAAVILMSERSNFAHNLFRGLCLCGFLLLAQGMRLMIDEETMRPDGYLHIDQLAERYDAAGRLNEDLVTFNWSQLMWTEPASFRTACVYLKRGEIIFAKNPNFRHSDELYTPFQLGFGRKGTLIDALRLSEETISFTQEDRALIDARLQPWIEAMSYMPHPSQVRDAPPEYGQHPGVFVENND